MSISDRGRSCGPGLQRLSCRYYGIAGLTIRVEADLPITNDTFAGEFRHFETAGPGDDVVCLRHHFALPHLEAHQLGHEVYHRPPWVIYRRDQAWIYLGIHPGPGQPTLSQVAVFDLGHTSGDIYSADDKAFRNGLLHSVTLFPTDQILLARVLADRQGCYLHAAGVILNSQGLLFVGHSEAGKSTMVKMLQGDAEILCDDRIIMRRWPEGFRIHGTWSHGEVPIVSPGAAPLRAIFLLEKADTNRIIPILDRKELIRLLPFFVIRPLITADWWEKTLDLFASVVRNVPVYRLQFDRSGAIKDLLKAL